MPFTAKDAAAKNKALKTAKQKRNWVEVANSILAKCIKKGGTDKTCAPKAILRANGVLKKQMEEGTDEGGGAPRTSSVRLSKEKQEATMNGDLFEIARSATEIGLALANDSGEVNTVEANEALRQMREQLKEHQPKGGDAKVAERLRYPPYGITSFADLQTAEAADEAADEVRLLTVQFNEMVNNIMWSSEITDKGASIRALADEFVGLIEQTVDDGMRESDEPIDSSIGAIAAMEIEVAELEPGSIVQIVEDSEPSPRSPLVLDVAIIEPGWGNTKNNNYYPKDMLAAEAHKLVGVKMYVTQHKEAEKNVRTEVSEILACPVGFTATGGPIARVGVFDAQFAENTRNRSALGKLEHLHTSLYGTGAFKEGKIDGRKGHIIESFTHIGSVDWVTRAGAGGRALNIVESANGTEDEGGEQMDEQEVKDKTTDTVELEETVIEEKDKQTDEQADEQALEEETQEPEVTMLSETAVDEILANPGVNLPKISVTRLSEREYGDEQAVRDAVAAEVSYIKALTGSGKPQDLGSTQALEQTVMTEAERATEFDKILTRHNMRPLSERMV